MPAKPASNRRPTPPHLPAQAGQPRANGRPPPDFSSLPPAIAESLAKLAGRTVPPLAREEAAAATDAGEAAEDKPRQT
jgi:hypothetical protein